MTALSIQPPFPIITDIDGQPLEDGYIWIGVANLPPIGNPIAVYWDAALTQPAALPVRTRGGYPVNAGTPARLYVNSDYSIQVQNKNGSVVYSAPQATERYGALIISSADISFLQAGSGAVVRTAQSKMRDVVSVKDFGAVGDGVTDDTVAIQDALDAVSAGGATIYFPAGNYKISKGLSVTKDQTTLLGAGKFNTEISPLASFDRVTYDALITIGDGTSTDNGANCVLQNLSVISTYNNDGDDVSGVCNNNYYNTDIINCELKGGNPDNRQTGGIYIKRGLHIRISECNLHNGYGYGALLSGGNDITFSNCAFDETQAGIVTDNNVFRMRIENCVFGNLQNNTGYPAAKTGSMIDLTTGAHDVAQIIDCVFEGNTSNTYSNYGVNSDNVDTLIVQGCRFTDMRRMAICKRSNKAMMVLNNYFYNCGWSGSTFDATLGTTNPDTTTFVPDVYSVGASTNATLIVGNRTATNVRSMSWLEGSSGSPSASECIILGNFAAHSAGYVRGVYAYDTNPFVRGQGSNGSLVSQNGPLFVGCVSQIFGTAAAAFDTPGLGVVSRTSAGATEACFAAVNTATSGNNQFVWFYSDSSPSFRASIEYNRGAGLVAYNTTSDYRAKDIIGSVTNSGSVIDSLNVYIGKMKGASIEMPMLLAHEAQTVAPYAVTGNKDAVGKDGHPIFQQMNASSLVPLLIAELQSLRSRVKQLEAT
jgi:hypothetical protein